MISASGFFRKIAEAKSPATSTQRILEVTEPRFPVTAELIEPEVSTITYTLPGKVGMLSSEYSAASCNALVNSTGMDESTLRKAVNNWYGKTLALLTCSPSRNLSANRLTNFGSVNTL